VTTTKPSATSTRPPVTRPATTVRKTAITKDDGTKRPVRATTGPGSVAAAASKRTSSSSSGLSNVLPHSRPRPVSVNIPPPPAAAKSTKAPTVANFELPGEVFARKIAAQKEERKKRMEEEEKKRKEMKASGKPVLTAPSSRSSSSAEKSKPPTKPTGVPRCATIVPKKDPAASTSTIRAPAKEGPIDRAAQAQAVLKARKEAAERTRETVRQWAEQKTKNEKAKVAAAKKSASPETTEAVEPAAAAPAAPSS
jgi:hypothetical protein